MPKEKKPFVNFREIRSRITMEQVLDHYGVLGTFKRTGTRLSGPCPIHGGSNPTQFRVETEKNIWNCFSDCKRGGNALDFIATKEAISIHEAALKACEWFGIPNQDAQTSSKKIGKAEPKESSERSTGALAQQPPETATQVGSDPKAPNPPLKFTLDKLQFDHPYLLECRGLTPETIAEFGLGYFTGQKGLMVGRIVIPIRNIQGELVAYAGRWPGDPPNTEAPKYKLPPNFRKSLELFNADRAFKEPADAPLAIVEGYFDAIKLYQNGWRKVVALMGSTMSPAQELIIREHTTPQSHIVVMLDEDEAGIFGREDITAHLARFCFVKTHVFEEPGMQPEHLSAGDVQEILEVAM